MMEYVTTKINYGERLEEERARLEGIKQKFEMADQLITNEELDRLLLNQTFFIPGNITNSTQLRSYIYSRWEQNVKMVDSIKEIYDIFIDTFVHFDGDWQEDDLTNNVQYFVTQGPIHSPKSPNNSKIIQRQVIC